MECTKTVDQLLDYIPRELLSRAEILLQGGRRTALRFANSEIHQNTNVDEWNIRLRLYEDARTASCQTNVFTDAGLRQLVENTERLLAVAPDDEENQHRFDTHRTFLTSVSYVHFGLEEMRVRGMGLRDALELIPEGFTAAGSYHFDEQNMIFAKRNATVCQSLETVQFNTVVTHTDSGAEGGGELMCHKSELDFDIKPVLQRATDWARQGAHKPARKPKAGAYTVILSPTAVCDLISYVVDALNAKCVADRRSFLALRELGKRALGKNITLTDDATDIRLFPWPFDFEGSIRQRLPLITDGVPVNLLHDKHTARAMGHIPSGHAGETPGGGGHALHVVMHGGDSSLDSMIRGVQQGIYVSELHYTNLVTPQNLQVTGLTRGGTFLIENGVLTRPLPSLRFTETLTGKDGILQRVTALSEMLTLVNMGGWAWLMPSARIEGFKFS